jgi:hypothetical protein
MAPDAALESLLEEFEMSLVVPAACTLPTAERPVRLAEFDDLFVLASLTERAGTVSGRTS